MPTRQLPQRPNLNRLKVQAADLLKRRTQADPPTLQRIREFHPRFAGQTDEGIASALMTWSDALFIIAREYGFRSWPRLKAAVEIGKTDSTLPAHDRVEDPAFRQAIAMMDDGDADLLVRHLQAHPGLAERRVFLEGGNYFTNPGLIGFIAENPMRHESMPHNAVEIARIVLEAGANNDRAAVQEALDLVASGRVARDSGLQTGLIDLFCDFGADPDAAMTAALAHGEFDAVRALLHRGAALNLTVAAALGLTVEAQATLGDSTEADKHLALALAAQFGHVAVAELLLDAGANSSRYNPPGAHSHSTPLHQAALAGHEQVVRLLLERGARRDLRDTLFQGTPLDWANHAGQTAVAEILQAEAP